MYFQKKLLPMLMSLAIVPFGVQAEAIEVSDIKEPTKIKGLLTTKEAGNGLKTSEHAPYLIFPKLSGDGKTLVLENGAAESEIAAGGHHTPVLSGGNFENRELIDTIGRDGVLSISYDGLYIYPTTSSTDYYEKKNEKWETIRGGNNEIQILGVTTNNLLFGQNRTTSEFLLLDPKNGQVIMKKMLLEDMGSTSFSPPKTPFVATYSKENGETTILTTSFGPGMNDFDIVYSDGGNWKKQTLSLDNNGMLEGFFFSNTYGNIGGLENFLLPRLSPNGKVVLGPRNKVYFGQDYQDQKTLTKTLNGKNYTDGFAWASNFDGSIIGGGVGEQFNDVDNYLFNVRLRPVIWYGENWNTIKDLGTLGGKDTDNGIVHSMSHDGKVVAGMSHNADGDYVPTLWYLSTTPSLIDPERVKVDIDDIGRETLKTFQNQRYGLLSLLEGCRVEGGEGHYCLEQRSSLWGQKQDREAKVGVSMAYALTDNFSVGGIIEHSVYNNLFDKNKHRNLGLGLFAEWRDKQANKEFYIRPAISFSYHNGSLARPISVGTEYAYGKIKQKGAALSLTVGEQYSLAENTKFDWFAGIRYLDLKQKGYQDSAEYFPIQYNAIGYKEGSVFAGLGLKKGLTEKLSWLSKVELEQVIYQRNPEFYAYNEHLGAVSFKQKLAKNSFSVSTGLEYKFNDTFRISLIPSITKASAQPLRWNVGLYLTGQF